MSSEATLRAPPLPKRSSSLLGMNPTSSAMKKSSSLGERGGGNQSRSARIETTPQITTSSRTGKKTHPTVGIEGYRTSDRRRSFDAEAEGVVASSFRERGGFGRMRDMFENPGNTNPSSSMNSASRTRNQEHDGASSMKGKRTAPPKIPTRSASRSKIDNEHTEKASGESKGVTFAVGNEPRSKRKASVSAATRQRRARSVNSCNDLIKEAGVGVRREPETFTETLREKDTEKKPRSIHKQTGHTKGGLDLYCWRCGELVQFDSVNAMGKIWHKKCFFCEECKNLVTTKFSRRNGYPLCMNCSRKKTHTLCSYCGKAIESNAMNIDGSLIHPGCFKCGNCKKAITGQYGEKNGKAYCMNCLQKPLVLLSLFKK